MKKWFLSETHFSRKNIIKDSNRPFETVEEMNRKLIENWNECVNYNDQVNFLGNFGQGEVEHLNLFFLN